MKRKIPYGVINWAKLVRECLFVDNTAYNWFDLPFMV